MTRVERETRGARMKRGIAWCTHCGCTCHDLTKKANDSKENEYLINKQSNEQLTTENCNGHDLPETSPSGIPMPVSTQEKKT